MKTLLISMIIASCLACSASPEMEDAAPNIPDSSADIMDATHETSFCSPSSVVEVCGTSTFIGTEIIANGASLTAYAGSSVSLLGTVNLNVEKIPPTIPYFILDNQTTNTVLLADVSMGIQEIGLAAQSSGRLVMVKDISGKASTTDPILVIATSTGTTIEGSNIYYITVAYGKAILISDAQFNWWVIGT